MAVLVGQGSLLVKKSQEGLAGGARIFTLLGGYPLDMFDTAFTSVFIHVAGALKATQPTILTKKIMALLVACDPQILPLRELLQPLSWTSWRSLPFGLGLNDSFKHHVKKTVVFFTFADRPSRRPWRGGFL